MKKITLLYLLLACFGAVNAQETVIYYDDFRFANNSGYQGYVTSNPGSVAEGDLIKRATDLPDETTVLGFTRPTNNIGDRTDTRDQRHVSLNGIGGGANLTGVTWAVADPVDISAAPNMAITFALRNRFRDDDGDADPIFQIMIASDYTFGTDPSTVTWTDITAQVKRASDDTAFAPNPNWHNFYYDASALISATGSDKVSIAFRYEFFAGSNAFSNGVNRNGNWVISDVRYVQNSNVLTVNDATFAKGLSVYPNPVHKTLHVNSDTQIKSVALIDVLGKEVWRSNTEVNTIDVSRMAQGMYLLRMTSVDNIQVTKRIVVN